MWNNERIRITASEEMSFENVDGRTTDGRTDGRRKDAGCLYILYSPADKWHIFLEPGNKVQTFFVDGFM